jgi:hypothetical protein
LLEKARTTGYFETAKDVERLKVAPDFAAIRNRPEFHKLVDSLTPQHAADRPTD